MPLVTLTPDEVDDLIYSARVGDAEAVETDLATLSSTYNVKQSVIIASAIDTAPEEEGGSGCCLLHYPAANGNADILKNLTTTLISALSPTEQALTTDEVKAVVNRRNHSGNTPLHWAALNTHLECVKLLVDAGADVSIKNEAGLDAIFLAERTDWKTQDESSQNQGQPESEEVDEAEVGADAGAGDAGPVSKGRQVVEWLLEFGNPAEVEATGTEES
ncbi:hypothetical protein ASPSYDRAFT_159153 [Aspergillus sydowii CBS 593.65]|uniref:Uncharacterized protein n=1 Tax=Aspergillus sydowii CBS 593.65 TaxID=1036612 RepID=A0A1L9T753_9EURO|nr:uncharacterized protein ASPSYDRAFT_159153 [Aspergillus sydowii CBS 593.65]OJJ55256.1 hypothetical protein ASPSYDRAFT_159153 [Aspergillus sydowii CBS 593.65]